jgi:hypothetical protein
MTNKIRTLAFKILSRDRAASADLLKIDIYQSAIFILE